MAGVSAKIVISRRMIVGPGALRDLLTECVLDLTRKLAKHRLLIS